MADYQKGENCEDTLVCKIWPSYILHHAIIVILPSAVIYVQERHLLIEPMCLQEKVKPTDDIVCTFATLSSFVSEKVDLAREGLTIYPKHSILLW